MNVSDLHKYKVLKKPQPKVKVNKSQTDLSLTWASLWLLV